ncbi:MAG TPA: nuclear transport factor 2 family protein [Candidatus Angelobacter sp.]|nr:nuclear transport factor 2 family protein [Candidatus Angelobacter sp.]
MIQISGSKRQGNSRLYSFVSFVVVCIFLGCAGAPQHPTWKNATGGEMHERLMWQAIRDKDWKNFEQHLAPAFVGVDPAGKSHDRAGWVEHWKSAAIHDYSMGEVTVQPAGDDMVLTYVVTLPGPADRLRVVSVWQQVKSGWILAASSMTPVRGD